MKRRLALGCLIGFPASLAGYCSAPSPAPSFTISAGNVTIPASGTGLISYTLTSVNGFVGSVSVTCTPPTPPADVREPVCGGGPVSPPITLAANAMGTGNVGLEPYVYFPPQTSNRRDHSRPGGGTNWSLAGVLMLGLALPRRRMLKSRRLLLTIGLLIGLGGITACSTIVTLTPGTYTYTLDASEVGNASSSATTTVQVTVPPGIDVNGTPPPL